MFVCVCKVLHGEELFKQLWEEDRLEALEGFQELLIKQSRGDLTEDISNRDTSSYDNKKRESFIV